MLPDTLQRGLIRAERTHWRHLTAVKGQFGQQRWLLSAERRQVADLIEALGLEQNTQVALTAAIILPALENQAARRWHAAARVIALGPAEVEQGAQVGDIDVVRHKQQLAGVRWRILLQRDAALQRFGYLVH